MSVCVHAMPRENDIWLTLTINRDSVAELHYLLLIIKFIISKDFYQYNYRLGCE